MKVVPSTTCSPTPWTRPGPGRRAQGLGRGDRGRAGRERDGDAGEERRGGLNAPLSGRRTELTGFEPASASLQGRPRDAGNPTFCRTRCGGSRHSAGFPNLRYHRLWDGNRHSNRHTASPLKEGGPTETLASSFRELEEAPEPDPRYHQHPGAREPATVPLMQPWRNVADTRSVCWTISAG